jgi:hypothetical protein
MKKIQAIVTVKDSLKDKGKNGFIFLFLKIIVNDFQNYFIKN